MSMIYNEDVYDSFMIEGLMNHYKIFLNELLDNDSIKLTELNYLSESEKNKILVDFNTTSVSYSEEETLLNLFSKQVKKDPNATAVLFQNEVLTYGELEEKSNELAHYLLDTYQIEKGDLLALKLDRGPWMIISILAVDSVLLKFQLDLLLIVVS